VRITEDITPPEPISLPPPAYPAAAKAANIEGTVIVKYVVNEDGTTGGVQAVKGPPELFDAAMSAVRAWRYKPALSEGRPVAVQKIAKLPFRIRTD
jgi:protein TonB